MQSVWNIGIYLAFVVFISLMAGRRKGILTGIFFLIYILLVSFVFIVISLNFTTNGLIIGIFAFLSPVIASILVMFMPVSEQKVFMSKQK
ncbi:hypothetical protein D9I28_08960 [Escherichia coli]|nr:hypothetical protein [Escherichia coli]EEW2111037.1 hypothetical protein [Escherichia coli]KKO36623.1 hypothetical protein XA44_22205 [Escherichia coli]MHU59429.1 hypothetical protein [Escherichia coli]